MDHRVHVRRMFAGANTTEGFRCFFDDIAAPQPKRVYILKGGPGAGKSTFLKAIGRVLVDQEQTVEFFHCSSDAASLDAVALPAVKVAVMDGTAPHVVEPKHPGLIEHVLPLGEYWDAAQLAEGQAEVIKWKQEQQLHFGMAYRLLAESRAAYDQWQEYHRLRVRPRRLQPIWQQLRRRIFCSTRLAPSPTPWVRQLFASAIAPQGVCEFIATLMRPDIHLVSVSSSIPFAAKDTVYRTAQWAAELGLSHERFHCPYLPDTLDMVHIPQLNTVVANGSAPFHDDWMPGDLAACTVDLEPCFQPLGTFRFAPEAQEAYQRCRFLIERAVVELQQAKACHQQVEEHYSRAMDFAAVDKRRDVVLQEILALVKEQD